MLISRGKTIPAALAAAGLIAAVSLRPQNVSDLASMTHDLRSTLKDFDERLRRIEKLVHEVAKAEKSGNRPRGLAPPEVISQAEDPSLKLPRAREAYERGEFEAHRQNYEKAIEFYSQAVDLDPSNDSAFLHRAYANERLGLTSRALSDVDRSLSIQPNNAQAFAFRANLYRSLKDYDRAMADLEEALARKPNEAEFLLSQAGIEEERGNFQGAVRTYTLALRAKPDETATYVRLATAMKQMNDVNGALQICSAAIGLKPDFAEGYACRADSYIRLGQLPSAIADLNLAIHYQPDLPQAARLLPVARQLLELNEAQKPVEAAAAKPQPAPTPPPITAVPINKVEAEKPAEPPKQPPPSEPIQVANRTDPRQLEKMANSLRLIGRAYVDRGMYAAAIESLTKAVDLDPTSAVAFNSRGYAELRSLDYQAAIADFSRAIEINPAYGNAYWNRGIARRLSGDRDGGRTDMRKAAQLGWPTVAH